MVWLPDSEKNFDGVFIRFDITHERDRQTHTDRHRITARPRLCIASRGKKKRKIAECTCTRGIQFRAYEETKPRKGCDKVC